VSGTEITGRLWPSSVAIKAWLMRWWRSGSSGMLPMHPNLLRHACATHMLDNGCPLDVISQILGHDSLDVTAYYTQVSTRLMMKEYNGSASAHAKVMRRED
jgi:site-specific recombinase XerD